VSYNAQIIGLPFNLTTDFKPALGLSGEVQGNWLPHPAHSLLFGVDYKLDDVESKYYGARQGRAIAPYFQELWKISQLWQIHAGVRYDTYVISGDSLETQLSPKLGASYNFLPSSILHFSFGRGFRVPSIAERFSQTPPGTNVKLVSNPNLQPERSTLFDLGIRQRFGENVSADVTAFWNKYDDLIELTQLRGQLGGQFQNYPEARVRGLEAEIKARGWKNRLRLEAALSWMESRSLADDETSGLKKDQALPYRPRFTAFVTPGLSFGPATLEADFRYASRYETVTFYPLDERVPQKVVDMRLLYRWGPLTMQLSTKNAINYNYTQVERVLSEIRSFAFSINGEF
jgi:outer membrane receptor protein involved in Fe transport